MRILVVCSGNTCRSPAAGAAIRSAARRAGIEIEVSTAGISAAETGRPPTPVMVEAARARGILISGTASQVTAEEVEAADLILAMDRQIALFLQALAPTSRVELLGIHGRSGTTHEIPDPYGGDEAAYEATLDRIIDAADAFVASLSD